MSTAKEIANSLSRMVNSMSSDPEEREFVEAVTNMHRTLQQKAAGLFLKCFAEWSRQHKAELYDDRNAATVRISTAIMELMEDLNYAYEDTNTEPATYRVGLPYI